jgi:16S rRNA processing protein RimM
VRNARRTPKGVLLSLHEVSDRDGAEAICGWSVSLEREVLPPLEAGEYYLCDTVGADVLGPDGARVGRVVDLRMYPSLDAVLIELEGGGHAEQPLLEHWLEEVDVAARRIVLKSTDGLLEVGDDSTPSEAQTSSDAPQNEPAPPAAPAPGKGGYRARKAERSKRQA